MHRRPRLVLPAFIAALAWACAAPRREPEPPPPPERPLESAVDAWRAGDYRAARFELLQAYNRHDDRPLGRRALLALAATELDPRNPERQPDVASAFAARYVHDPDAPAWTAPVAETLYLLSLDLGARALDSLPALPGPPLAARLRELQLQRDSLAARTSALEGKLATLEQHAIALEQELGERRKELARIRKALKH